MRARAKYNKSIRELYLRIFKGIIIIDQGDIQIKPYDPNYIPIRTSLCPKYTMDIFK